MTNPISFSNGSFHENQPSLFSNSEESNEFFLNDFRISMQDSSDCGDNGDIEGELENTTNDVIFLASDILSIAQPLDIPLNHHTEKVEHEICASGRTNLKCLKEITELVKRGRKKLEEIKEKLNERGLLNSNYLERFIKTLGRFVLVGIESFLKGLNKIKDLLIILSNRLKNLILSICSKKRDYYFVIEDWVSYTDEGFIKFSKSGVIYEPPSSDFADVERILETDADCKESLDFFDVDLGTVSCFSWVSNEEKNLSELKAQEVKELKGLPLDCRKLSWIKLCEYVDSNFKKMTAFLNRIISSLPCRIKSRSRNWSEDFIFLDNTVEAEEIHELIEEEDEREVNGLLEMDWESFWKDVEK